MTQEYLVHVARAGGSILRCYLPRDKNKTTHTTWSRSHWVILEQMFVSVQDT